MPIVSDRQNADVPPLRKQGREATRSDSGRRFAGAVVFTVAGLLIALMAALFFPQVAELELKTYTVHPLWLFAAQLNRTQAYGIVLAALILIYLISALSSWPDPARRARFIKRAPFRFACGIVLTVWDILGTKLLLLPQPFFPGPSQILETFLIEGVYVGENMLYSLRLFTVGFLLGIALGVGTGVLIGWFPKVYYWVQPVLKITGVIPAVAWMPFALTLFPTPFSAAVFLIVICVWFPVASLSAQGIASTPKIYFEVARTLGAKTGYLVFHVAVPNALPQIFTGITTANAFAFTTLVISEMMGQPGGLGYYINASKVWSAYYKVFAAILIMAILFSLITWAVGLIQRRALRWQRGLVR